MVDWGPQGSFGYVFHTGWGVRGNYEYLRGTTSLGVTNANPAVTITSASAAFPMTSPSATLAAGIGVDQYTFGQRLEKHVADIEAVKEAHFLDTTLLFSVGGRYARMTQSYSATRINPGGAAAGATVALDRDDLNVSNRFEGWGLTTSMEAVHPLGCGFAVYGNVRGSFLWGTDRFAQNDRVQTRTVNAAGAANFADTTTSLEAIGNRYVSVLELESGVQFGCRAGRTYLFARAGGVYQRWWDVGNPTAAGGSLTFLGGTARVGITY